MNGVDRCDCGAFLPSVGNAAWEVVQGMPYERYGEVETRCASCEKLHRAYDMEVVTPSGRATGKTFALVWLQSCPKCGARSGEGCTTPTSFAAFPHAARIKAAPDPDPGILSLIRESAVSGSSRTCVLDPEERRDHEDRKMEP